MIAPARLAGQAIGANSTFYALNAKTALVQTKGSLFTFGLVFMLQSIYWQ